MMCRLGSVLVLLQDDPNFKWDEEKPKSSATDSGDICILRDMCK